QKLIRTGISRLRASRIALAGIGQRNGCAGDDRAFGISHRSTQRSISCLGKNVAAEGRDQCEYTNQLEGAHPKLLWICLLSLSCGSALGTVTSLYAIHCPESKVQFVPEMLLIKQDIVGFSPASYFNF